MKHLTQYFILFVACFLLACQNDDSVVFSYSPETPRAGETVSFSNLTDEGEEWAWDFGDGGTSTVKSPNKVYREPGTYTVTLTVDDKKYRTATKTITILDTVPTLRCSVDTIPYFTAVTFSVEVYNPNNESVSCKWRLPQDAVITSKDTTAASLSAYFTSLPDNKQISVHVDVTMGDTVFNLWSNFTMKDRPAIGIILGDSNGIYRQRIYPEGVDKRQELSVGNNKLRQLICSGDDLYYLEEYFMNILHLTDGNYNTERLFGPSNTSCMYLEKPYLYYNVGNNLYQYHLTVKQHTSLVRASDLTDFPSKIHALAKFTSIYYVAQAQGVYRFTEQKEALGVILADHAITHLTIDNMARKLYFIAEGALYVSNIDGTSPVQLAPKATALCIDNISSRIYYATAEGVVYLPLVQSQNNTTTAEPVVVNNTPNVVALAADNTAR